MNHLGIDILTKHKSVLIARLRGLVSTVLVADGGVYHEDPNYSQVHVATHKTADELDDWLYKSNLDYVGTFLRREK